MDKIEHFEGGTMFAGKDAVNVMRLITLKSGLKFELRCPGMKLTRGPSCLAIAKTTTGLKTNDRLKHIERLELMIAQARSQVVEVSAQDVQS